MFKIDNDSDLQLYYGFAPVEKQVKIMEAILDPQWKEVVIDAGRAFGKDLTIGAILSHICIMNPGTRILFVTPFYSQIESFWEQVMEGVNEDTGEFWVPQLFDIQQQKKQIRYFNGSVIVCMSAENPKAIRSKRANIIVVNEAAFISETIINKELRAVRKKNKGKTIYISTPNGKNWFYKKFVQGMRDPLHENYTKNAIRENVISFYATYKDNPLSSLDVEDMRANTPIKVFNQEVLAMFLDDTSVFTDLEKSFFDISDADPYMNKWVGEEPIKPYSKIEKDERGRDKEIKMPGARYVMGIDWAKMQDWTVFNIMNVETGKIVYWERLQQTDYTTQALKALEIAHNYNDAMIIYDATGVGLAVGDALGTGRLKPEYQKISLIPETFTNQFKQDIIQALAIRIERPGEFRQFIPAIPQIQHEMRVLQIDRTKTGLITYNAPDGEHDDCVMSLALCNWLWEGQRVEPSIQLAQIFR